MIVLWAVMVGLGAAAQAAGVGLVVVDTRRARAEARTRYGSFRMSGGGGFHFEGHKGEAPSPEPPSIEERITALESWVSGHGEIHRASEEAVEQQIAAVRSAAVEETTRQINRLRELTLTLVREGLPLRWWGAVLIFAGTVLAGAGGVGAILS